MRAITGISIIGFTLFVATNCFAAEQVSRPQINNYEAPGNLESKNDLGCVGTEKLENKFTPADLYKAIPACTKKGKYKEGAVLFALAGTYGRFDTLRVTDQSAYQAVTVLKIQAFSAMPPDQQNAFKESVSKTIGNPDGLAAVCKEIARIGPPNYYPRYMIQHGMGAFTKTGADDDGLVKNFNTSAAWQQSLDTYLQCPNL